METNSGLNTGNTCSHLVLGSEVYNQPIRDMYVKQLALQARLGKTPHPFATMHERVKEIIYWGHCVNDEFLELIDWMPAVRDSDLKETRMEFIDMIHFGFNIAVTLSMTPEDIDKGLGHISWHVQDIGLGIDIFDLLKTELSARKEFCKLVALMPWKTWKTYSAIPPIDIYKPKLENGFFNYMRVLLSIAGILGMDIQLVANMYFAKNAENHRRQDNGY